MREKVKMVWGWIVVNKESLLLIVSLLTLIATIWISFLENNRAQQEFDLRTRPYITVVADKVDDRWYFINITNHGLLPAKVVGRKGFVEGGERTKVNLTEARLSNVVGPGEKVSYNLILPSEWEGKWFNVIIEIEYSSAIEKTVQKENYLTQLKFFHVYGEPEISAIPSTIMT